MGEVGLEGDLRPIRGALPVALAARAAGRRGVLLPAANLPEAAVVHGLAVRGAATLRQVCDFVLGIVELRPAEINLTAVLAERPRDHVDFADVQSQAAAKRQVTT
jgi:magnesium chelatase family protein